MFVYLLINVDFDVIVSSHLFSIELFCSQCLHLQIIWLNGNCSCIVDCYLEFSTEFLFPVCFASIVALNYSMLGCVCAPWLLLLQ